MIKFSVSLFLVVLIFTFASHVCCEDYSDDEESEVEETVVVHNPKFISSSQTAQVIAGEDLSLPCFVDKLGSLVVQWRVKGTLAFANTISMTEDKRLSVTDAGARGNRLILKSVQPSDSGLYECRITTQPPIKLLHTVRVNYPPTVQITPSNGVAVVKQGSSVQLSCTAEGNPPPTITWTKKAGLLPYGDKKQSSSELVIGAVKREHHGLYQCTASNGVGKDAVENVQLDVTYAPEVEVVQEIVYTGPGRTARISCQVNSRPEAKVTWSRSDGSLLKSKRYNYSQEQNIYHLHIKDVRESDFGFYICQAENTLDKSEDSAILTGKPRPCEVTSRQLSDHTRTYTVQWQTHSYTAIQEYKIIYREVNRGRVSETSWDEAVIPVPQDKRTDTQELHQHSYNIVHLKPDTVYQVLVTAKNRYGWNELQKTPFNFTTQSLGARALGSVDLNAGAHTTVTSTLVVIGSLVLILF